MSCLIFHKVLSVQYIKHCHTMYLCYCSAHESFDDCIHDGVRIKQLIFTYLSGREGDLSGREGRTTNEATRIKVVCLAC